VALTCTLFGLLVGTGSASAHATLISTEPGQGAVIATLPALVSLTFDEPVVVASSGVRVFGPDGGEIDTGHAKHLDRSSTVGAALNTRRAQPGTYTVSWRVISADSHPVAGAFTFSVGHPSTGRAPPAAPNSSTAIRVSYAITRAAAFACYALLVGSVGFVLLCWPGAITRQGIRNVMLGGWAGLLATTMAALLLQGPYANGVGFDRLLDAAIISETVVSRLGTALTARLLLLALAGGCLVLLCAWLGQLTRRGRTCCVVLGVALALALAGTWAGADHAAVGLQPKLALPIDITHLLAMGTWLGGLVTLAVLLRTADDPSIDARAVERFSSIAVGSIVVLIGTGSYQSWRQLGSWGAFGSTEYGRLLLVKLAVFALILSTATVSHRWVTRRRRALIGVGAAALSVSPGAEAAVLRRSVLGEVVLGAIVLSLTAILVNTEPTRTATAAAPGPAHQSVSYDTRGPGGRGQLRVVFDPAATGPNTTSITVEDSAGNRRDVAELGAELTLTSRELGPFAVPLQHPELGRYEASGVQLPYPGDWQLRITVRTSEIDETSVVVAVGIR
jgi:copper transport protein